jgi:50S ribosomal protein L16 3-hydroxylase
MSFPKDAAAWPLQGIDPASFLKTYWQRKPMLLRQGLPGFKPLLGRAELFELAASEDAEARLVQRRGEQWSVQHGPFARRALPALRTPDWTLLVQGVNLLDDRVAALMERFRFVPDARMDDVMISWASDGGGVGPHVDDYDVFLLQAEGTRRWRLGPVADASMRPGQALKLLAHFEPDQDVLLEPGDVLYLPPGWGHDGIGVGAACMTYSVGFRAPPAGELMRQLLWKLADEMAPGSRYSDRGAVDASAALHPARLPDGMVAFLQDAFARLKPTRRQFEAALGDLLSEPKQQVWFEPSEQSAARQRRALERAGLRLDRRSRMLYSSAALSINGEQVEPALARSRLLRRLADARALTPQEWMGASAAEQEQLLAWCRQGWAGAGEDA